MQYSNIRKMRQTPQVIYTSERNDVEAIHAPRLNPPNMVDTNIETHFLSLEFWFAVSGISALHDTRKYNTVMAQVPPNKLTELRL